MIALPSSSTFREIRAHLTSPAALAVQVGVALVLGVSGPFDTFASMRPGPRMAYWAVMVFATYGTGYVLSHLTTQWVRPRVGARWLRVLVKGIVAGVGAGLVLGTINALAFSDSQFPDGWLQTLGLATTIALVVVTIEDVLSNPQEPEHAASGLPALLQRLPLDKRGALVSLSVSDHYVNVVTSNGQDLILIRLGDAMRETDPARGMQVHRSHWVALDQITSVRKTGETAMLRTSAGDDIPVSRTYMKALRENGLLPARATAEKRNG